ncbi:unnamed protein product, partial [marine sediment metagenome]
LVFSAAEREWAFDELVGVQPRACHLGTSKVCNGKMDHPQLTMGTFGFWLRIEDQGV